MSWFNRRQIPEVKIERNRFEIVPDCPDPNVVEVEPSNSPATRLSQPLMRPEPRVGIIPQHSWGT